MPHRCAPVGEIRCPPEVEVEVLMTGNLWEICFGGFWWVHSDDNITTPSNSSFWNFIMTIQTAKVYVSIAVSPSINDIGHFSE